MIAGYMNRNDLTRAALVLGKVAQVMTPNTDPEVLARARRIYTFGTSLHAMRIYVAEKIAAAAATAGIGWTYPP